MDVDILVRGSNEEEHYQRLKSVLDKAKQMNLKLNKDKCQIEKTEIKYIGHILSKDGLKADPDKIKAVLDMPAPTDKKGLERFNGMIQYLAQFIPNLSEISAPIRKLCEGYVAWHWDSEQEDSFNKLKKLVTNTPVLQYYDVNKEVTLSVDSSMLGLGAVLFQENKPIAYASKALTKSQQNYAQIEKEMLAIVFGCEKFHDYLSGKEQITVESDHKPLESIFKKPLYRAPIRLQRMLLTLQKYPLKVHFKPGKEMYVADTLSRAYLTDGNCVTSEDRFHVNMIEVSMSENRLSEIRSKTESDSELCKLKQTVLEGWPDTRNEVPEEIKKYWNIRDEITIAEDILFKAAKVIIPAEMRQEMLRQIHSAHFGIEKCIMRAKDVLYWPGMYSDIENCFAKCGICQKHRNKNKKEPMIIHELPDRPWSKIGADLFEWDNENYLILVDYYSGYFEIPYLRSTKSAEVIKRCKAKFSVHGIPDQLISDNGPQFSSSEFRRFAQSYNFKHITSSPKFPQSNGTAERAVQTAKRLLTKAKEDGKDPYLALLDFRNTPIDKKLGSPVQRLMGRRTRTLLPTSSELLKPKVIDTSVVTRRKQECAKKKKVYYDRQAKALPELSSGENVYVKLQNNWQEAKINSSADEPRSYLVESDGQIYRRNRKDIMKTKVQFQEPINVNEQDSSTQGENLSQKRDNVVGCKSSGLDLVHDKGSDNISVRHNPTRVRKFPAKYEDYVLSK